MGTLLDLAKSLETKLSKIEQRNSARVVKVATAILQDLVYVTPVDTSKALSNWQIGIKSPPSGVLPPYTPGARGSTRSASASEAIAEGIQRLSTKLPGETVYISNLTPYIGELDKGSSAQFAGGFKARARLIGSKVAREQTGAK